MLYRLVFSKATVPLQTSYIRRIDGISVYNRLKSLLNVSGDHIADYAVYCAWSTLQDKLWEPEEYTEGFILN